jgi:multidrug efflux pump subunit AcrA (membrane-fusion protein)
MTLGRLDNLTITVYVPEDRYGELSLGQSATMTVDSFPGETFTATVSHIAEQAEFTPRNVQTMEGRTSTVFAIKLQVQDPGGKLKPGMPADVTFTSNVQR